ncbi:MAG TPA: hypothetical protein VLT59_14360, partial [Steroidobacteraceae bacterium]|nr:hypothetical protein [Steroidobacteraceae bacterium]
MRMSFQRAGVLGVLLVASGLALTAGPAGAAPGDLDPTFGDYGRVRLDMPTDYRRAVAAVYPDGRVLIARSERFRARIRIVRLLADGRIDPSFGNGEYAVTDFGGGISEATAIAVQPDGRILIAGAAAEPSEPVSGFRAHVPTDIAIVALTADGDIDRNFGENGRVVIGGLENSDDQVEALNVTASGSILVAFRSMQDPVVRIGVLRLTQNGAVDRRFGTNGSTSIDTETLASYGLEAGSVVEQSDGKVVLCGTRVATQSTGAVLGYVLVMRLRLDGTLDPSFDADGLVVAGSGYAESCATLPDGGVVVVADFAGTPMVHALRLRADGSLDQTFAGDGHFEHALGISPDYQGITGWGYSNEVRSVDLLPDGRLALGCLSGDFEPAVLVMSSDGETDASFGPDGLRRIDVGTASQASEASELVSVANASGIVVVATYQDKVTVARLN